MTIVPVPGPCETHLTVAGLDRSIALHLNDPDGHSPEFIAMPPRSPQPMTGRMMLSERNKSRVAKEC